MYDKCPVCVAMRDNDIHFRLLYKTEWICSSDRLKQLKITDKYAA